MSDLVVIGFDDEHTAFEMRAELVKLQKAYLIEMDDVVVVTKNDKGNVKLHQALNLTAAVAVCGSFWGMLIGMIFLNPLVGAAVGAGALSGRLRDIGISDDFMKELGETITPGPSALFVLVRKATPDKVLEELKGFKGTMRWISGMIRTLNPEPTGICQQYLFYSYFFRGTEKCGWRYL